MQKPSKIDKKIKQKWTNNQSWRRLGGPLGALGGQDRKNTNEIPTFGASWGHPGAVLGASWGRLGAWIAVLGRLGPSWASWAVLKSMSKSIKKSMPFRIDFWSIFHPKLAPKVNQNRRKIDAKMHFILHAIFRSNFDRFCSQLRPPKPKKSLIFFFEFSLFFEISALEVKIDFWSHFIANLAPFSLPKSTKIQQKSDPKKASNFWSIFASIFSSFWLPLGIQVGAMLATFSSKMEGPCARPPPFSVALVFFLDFFPRDAGVPHRIVPQTRWGTPLGLGFRSRLGLIFEGFVVHFC